MCSEQQSAPNLIPRRRRFRAWKLIIGLVALVAAVLVGRVVYAFTDAGRFARLLDDLKGEHRFLIDRVLAHFDLINPPYPEPFSMTLGEMQQVRPLEVDEWASLIYHDHYGVRGRAIDELLKAGDPRVARALAVEYSREYPVVWRGYGPFIELAKRTGYEPFAALLNDADEDVRVQSAAFLVISGRKEGLPVIIDELARITGSQTDELDQDDEQRVRQMQSPAYRRMWRARDRRLESVLQAIAASTDPAAAEALEDRRRKIEEYHAKRYERLMAKESAENPLSAPDRPGPGAQREEPSGP